MEGWKQVTGFLDHRQQNSVEYSKNAQRMREVLATNFDAFITRKEEGSYFGSNLLLSCSKWLKNANDITFSGVPASKLEQARMEGQQLMYWLQYIIDNKITKIDELNYESEVVRLMVYEVVKTLAKHNFKIRAVEKHVSNERWHGFIDLICFNSVEQKYYIFELKTRNESKPRITDGIQLHLYRRIIGGVDKIPLILMVVNKKKMETTMWKPDGRTFGSIINKVINEPLKILGKEKYCIL